MTIQAPDIQLSLFGGAGGRDEEAKKRESIWLGVTKSALQKYVRGG